MTVVDPSLVERSRSLYTKALATIFSALAYGVVFTLSISCYQALSVSMAKQATPFCLKTRILRMYTTFMFMASTLAIIQTIYSFMVKLDNSSGFEYESNFFSHGFTSPLALPFAVWGADGFMTWRCLVLYVGISRKQRLALRLFLAFLSLFTFASGVLLLITSTTYQAGTLFLIPIYMLENITLTSLIVCRIIYHQSKLGPTVGHIHSQTYSWIMGMCIESCALIVTFPMAWLIIIFSDGYAAQILASVLPHICVIAALMLVYRVAQGRELVHQPSYDDSQLDRIVNDGLRRLDHNCYSAPTSATHSQTYVGRVVTPRPAPANTYEHNSNYQSV